MKKLIPLTFALAGCNTILGVGDFTTSPPDPNTVTGTSIIDYIVFDGTVQQAPEDLSKYVIKVYIPDGMGHFSVVDGVGKADGTFEIKGVPVGAKYYLYLLYPQIPNHPTPTPLFWETDARTLDLGYTVMGRSDGVEATRASTVTLQLTNVTPWANGDAFLFDSYNNGSEFLNDSLVSNPPAIGATSFTGYSFDWRDGYTYHPIGSLPRLVDSSKGDDLYVTQFHRDVVNQSTWTYALDRELGVLAKMDITQVDGTPLLVSGALVTSPLNKTIGLHIPLSTFRAQYAADGGRAVAEGINIQRIDNAGTQYYQRIGAGPWAVTIPPAQDTLAAVPATVDLSSIVYGDSSLFPAAWGQNATGAYHHRRLFEATGATVPGVVQCASELQRAVTGTFFDMQPAVRPVQKIQVDTIDTLTNTGTIPYDGATGPVISWDPVTAADGYTISVSRVFNDGGMTQRQVIFSARTTGTSFTIPPDLIKKGERYLIGVITQLGLDDAGLRRFRVPEGNSRQFGNVFLFSDKCGDGVVQTDLGEECDTMGQSATCDSDCSLPVCGDANTNTAAGEMCDFGGDAVGCDHDCTPVACNDGVFNSVAEICDDGNTNNTDGCDQQCHRTGTCGDGTVQPSVEDCDPPNGTTCGPDCHPL